MNDYEARLVAEIATCADGGCASCAIELLNELHRAFPYFDAIWASAYMQKWRYGEEEWMLEAAPRAYQGAKAV